MGGLRDGEALSKEKKETLSNKRNKKKMIIWWKKIELDSYIVYKVNSKWIEELNIKNKTSKLILKT